MDLDINITASQAHALVQFMGELFPSTTPAVFLRKAALTNSSVSKIDLQYLYKHRLLQNETNIILQYCVRTVQSGTVGFFRMSSPSTIQVEFLSTITRQYR